MIKRLLFLLLFTALGVHAESQLGYITFGPMLHWNSQDYEVKFSWGFEVSYWSYTPSHKEGEGWFSGSGPELGKPGYGMDLGFDYEHETLRVYAEPQIGWGLAGCSMGPVWKFPGAKAKGSLGIQGSLWGSMIGGVDLRLRELDGAFVLAPGLFAKAGGLVSGRP